MDKTFADLQLVKEEKTNPEESVTLLNETLDKLQKLNISKSNDKDTTIEKTENEELKEEKKLFGDFKAHFNWSPAGYNGNPLPLTDKEVEYFLSTMDKNEKSVSEEMKKYTMQYYSNELIAKYFAKVYFATQLKMYTKAEESIGQVLQIILQVTKNKYPAHENVDGYLFVLKGLEAYLFFKWGIDQAKTKNLLEEMNNLDYNTLGAKGKVGIYILNLYYLSFFKENLRMQDQIDILVKLLVMDADNYEWHYFLFKLFRRQRRERKNMKDKATERELPTFEERGEIITALNCSPHPLSRIGQIICLADIAQITDTNWPGSVELGEKEFKSERELINYIKTEAKKLAEEFKLDYRINMDVGLILSRILPFKHRDYKVAKECLDQMLELSLYPNTTYSRSYHKHAIFYLTAPEPYANFATAKYSIRKAVEHGPANFPALIDLIQINMSRALEDGFEIKKLFEMGLNEFSEDRRRANLLYIKGCFHLIRNERLEAVESWNESFEINKDELNFEKIHAAVKRYQWKRINIHMAFDVILFTQQRDTKFTGLMDFVKKIIDSFPPRPQRSENWRDRRGFGAHRGAFSHNNSGDNNNRDRNRGQDQKEYRGQDQREYRGQGQREYRGQDQREYRGQRRRGQNWTQPSNPRTEPEVNNYYTRCVSRVAAFNKEKEQRELKGKAEAAQEEQKKNVKVQMQMKDNWNFDEEPVKETEAEKCPENPLEVKRPLSRCAALFKN